ncbi:MAG: hypothetical protein JOZ69_05915 [Myxococcales bacterium]|nr:hypothetical protein [Myxococcales bacterium]
MAEQQKPKIDLKSRLQRMGPAPAGSTPPTAGQAPGPSALPPAARSVPPAIPGGSGAPVPPPPGIPIAGRSGPTPALDPRNPLAAVAGPGFKPAGAAAAAPMAVAIAQPQRIEVDEAGVRQARSGGRKQGIVIGLVLAVGAGAVCWVGGTASQQGAARAQGVHDAHDLAADLTKAKDSLDQLKKNLQDGTKSLVSDRKYPDDLGQKLAAVNVDFGGDKLFGRRFSGVPADTTRNLFDFITRVQALNDKKDLVVALLGKLQKPIKEELARPAGQLPIQYAVIVDKDTPNLGAFIAPLVTPIVPGAGDSAIPNELTFTNPRSSGNAKLPRLATDRIPREGAAITVAPNTFEKVCPSSQRGQIAQLVASMNSLIGDIEGQKPAEGGDVITETKPGLGEVAVKLADSLNKVN